MENYKTNQPNKEKIRNRIIIRKLSTLDKSLANSLSKQQALLLDTKKGLKRNQSINNPIAAFLFNRTSNSIIEALKQTLCKNDPIEKEAGAVILLLIIKIPCVI